jgi:hypothetical protein
VQLGPELPDGPPPGGKGRKHHLHSADPQHLGPTRVRAQPHPVLPVHPLLRGQARLQLNYQVCKLVGLIINNDETAYSEEVRALGVWCLENNLSLNINKTKEMIMDLRKQQRVRHPIYINRTAEEEVESFKFLGVHITDKLKWTTLTDSMLKKAQQSLWLFT